MNDSLPDDRDRELAARLVESRDWPESEDGLVDALRAYRDVYEAIPQDARRGAAIWAKIERATRVGASRLAVRRFTPMRLVWGTVSIAAAVLILIAVPRILSPAPGQLLAEASTSQVEYQTADGSVITLRPGSRVFGTKVASEFRLEGEAFFSVTRNPDRIFSVATDFGRVEVLGTRFNVLATDTLTSVYLQEGSVRFLAGSSEVILEPGQRVAASERVMQPVESVSGVEDLDWISGRLVYESRSAGEVASELGRHFGITIQIPEGVRSEFLTGTLVLGEQSAALADFALVLGGQFVESGSGLRFIRN
ncbi:MAG: transmembrane sensor [Rhodothermales bacterium]|jgi:transmembrane sensor